MRRELAEQHQSDAMYMHPLAEAIRDCAALRKQIVQAETEMQDAGEEEIWANPVNEQYRAIFDSVRFVEEEISRYEKILDHYLDHK
jgi:hypothetical protein